MLVLGLIDIQHMQSKHKFFFSLNFKNCYYFSDLETQWLQNPELKSSSLQFTGNFMAPVGSLKIKTGLPTSPTCQRALITKYGQLTVIDHQIPAFAPDWSFSAKRCQIVIIVYWHNCLRASNSTLPLVNKPLQQPSVYSLSLHGVYWRSCVVWWDTKIVGDVTLFPHLSDITCCHKVKVQLNQVWAYFVAWLFYFPNMFCKLKLEFV